MNSNEIRENETDERIDLEKMKLENNEDQAAERIRIAEEKLEIARMRKQK
jgi:SUMO ligase MMS21 Smc5/6 complex component